MFRLDDGAFSLSSMINGCLRGPNKQPSDGEVPSFIDRVWGQPARKNADEH